MFTSYLLNAAQKFHIRIHEKQLRQFNTYYELLLVWNEKMNLTAITEPLEVAVKHMIDSLSCYDEQVFVKGCSVVDVGTGAGFPGVPLKIMYPDIKLTLVDSLNKRVVFLQELTAKLGFSDIDIFHARAEEFAKLKERRETYDVAVSRAVARLNILCELCLPLVKINGHFLALKGAQFEQEVREAQCAVSILGGRIQEIKPIVLPGIDDVRAVIDVVKIEPCPKKYPRKPGTPEKKPL